MEKFQPLSAIQDRGVVDPSGEHVGYIHDVLFDLYDGRIAYICIALAASVGDVACEVVVPWSAVRTHAEAAPCWEVAAKKRLLQDIAQPISERTAHA